MDCYGCGAELSQPLERAASVRCHDCIDENTSVDGHRLIEIHEEHNPRYLTNRDPGDESVAA